MALSKKQLQALALGRATRQANLQARQLPKRKRFVKIPRNTPIINPRFINPDLNFDERDANFNEKISADEGLSAKGETLFANLDDIIPRPLQKRRR